MNQASARSSCSRCGSQLSPDLCGGLCTKCVAKSLLSTDELVDSIDSSSTSPVRFDTLTLIGAGGMGAVYEAYDRRLSRNVALKFLHAELMSSPAARLRFELETLISSQLEHPGVIPVYDVGHDVEGRPFYVMRRIEGTTLNEVLSGLQRTDAALVQRYPLSALIAAFVKICEAVAFAHARKIIHRDLKPANIMLGRFNEVFVMDWGLAKPLSGFPALESLIENDAYLAELSALDRERMFRFSAVRSDTNPNALLGTLGFMAPEQAEGNGVDADERTDIYALGAILYSILTLRPPVAGERRGSVLRKTASGEIEHPLKNQHRYWVRRGERLPHCSKGRIPAALAEIAMKGLSKLPRNRYQTVKELLTDLASAEKNL
jgi:serine/threonine protein kinase